MGEELDSLEQSLLRHLLTYRGHQVRFEADARTTEFGIYRSFTDLESGLLKNALRQLEVGRWIYRRVQYVIGFSEPKLVYSLTPNGYRKALDLAQGPPVTVPATTPVGARAPANGPVPETVPDSPRHPGKSSGRRRDRSVAPPKNE